MINEVLKLQRKAIRIITLNNKFSLAKPLFKELKILPFHKMMQMQNYHIVLSHLNNNLPVTFRDFFKYANNQHQHHTKEAYGDFGRGLQSIKYKAAKDWDEIQKELKNINLSDEYLSKNKFSKAFKRHSFDNGN